MMMNNPPPKMDLRLFQDPSQPPDLSAPLNNHSHDQPSMLDPTSHEDPKAVALETTKYPEFLKKVHEIMKTHDALIFLSTPTAFLDKLKWAEDAMDLFDQSDIEKIRVYSKTIRKHHDEFQQYPSFLVKVNSILLCLHQNLLTAEKELSTNVIHGQRSSLNHPLSKGDPTVVLIVDYEDGFEFNPEFKPVDCEDWSLLYAMTTRIEIGHVWASSLFWYALQLLLVCLINLFFVMIRRKSNGIEPSFGMGDFADGGFWNNQTRVSSIGFNQVLDENTRKTIYFSVLCFFAPWSLGSLFTSQCMGCVSPRQKALHRIIFFMFSIAVGILLSFKYPEGLELPFQAPLYSLHPVVLLLIPYIGILLFSSLLYAIFDAMHASVIFIISAVGCLVSILFYDKVFWFPNGDSPKSSPIFIIICVVFWLGLILTSNHERRYMGGILNSIAKADPGMYINLVGYLNFGMIFGPIGIVVIFILAVLGIQIASFQWIMKLAQQKKPNAAETAAVSIQDPSQPPNLDTQAGVNYPSSTPSNLAKPQLGQEAPVLPNQSVDIDKDKPCGVLFLWTLFKITFLKETNTTFLREKARSAARNSTVQ